MQNGREMEIVTRPKHRSAVKEQHLAVALGGAECDVCDGSFASGHLGNLPAGECYFGPAPGTGDGGLVLDGAFSDAVFHQKASIILTFEGGRLSGIAAGVKGKSAAASRASSLSEALARRLGFGEGGGHAAFYLGEVAIGLNPLVSPEALTGACR